MAVTPASVLAETSADLIRGYVEEAIAAEKSFEAQLRKFADEGDDEDVQAAFAAHADQTQNQHERLAERLEQLGSRTSNAVHPLPRALELTQQVSEAGHIQEELTVQHLIIAYAMEMSESAFYEALATIAVAATDTETEALARQIQAEEQEAGKKFFSLIRSRSKIAYNMLTPNELDPAVETKAFDNRVV